MQASAMGLLTLCQAHTILLLSRLIYQITPTRPALCQTIYTATTRGVVHGTSTNSKLLCILESRSPICVQVRTTCV